MSNKQQTSVEWLAEKYDYITWMRKRDEISPAAADKWRKDFLEQAKEMHKEEIVKAISFGDERGKITTYSTAEQYYKENYEDRD